MDPLAFVAVTLVIILALYQLTKLLRSDYDGMTRELRLRRRGRHFYSAQSINFTLKLFVPKLLCRLGLHDGSSCRRWFCKEFHGSSATVQR